MEHGYDLPSQDALNLRVFGLRPEFVTELEPEDLKAVTHAIARGIARTRHEDTGSQRGNQFGGFDLRDMTAAARSIGSMNEDDVRALQARYTKSFLDEEDIEERYQLKRHVSNLVGMVSAREELILTLLAPEARNPVRAFAGVLLLKNFGGPKLQNLEVKKGGAVNARHIMRPENPVALEESPEWVRLLGETYSGTITVAETANGYFVYEEADSAWVEISQLLSVHPEPTSISKDGVFRLHMIVGTISNKTNVPLDRRLYTKYYSEGKKLPFHIASSLVGFIPDDIVTCIEQRQLDASILNNNMLALGTLQASNRHDTTPDLSIPSSTFFEVLLDTGYNIEQDLNDIRSFHNHPLFMTYSINNPGEITILNNYEYFNQIPDEILTKQ